MQPPCILRLPDMGIVILFKVGRVWSHVIERKARRGVIVKKIKTDYLNKYAKPFEYQHGIAHAADLFLHPGTRITAKVSPAAKLILEGLCLNSTSTQI